MDEHIVIAIGLLTLIPFLFALMPPKRDYGKTHSTESEKP